MNIETLKQKCTTQEAAELAILHNARISCLKSYKDDPSAANKRNLDAAASGLDALVARLEALYPDDAGDPAGAVPADRWLANLLEASKWLKELGYKIGKSKLYKDRDKGLLYVWPDGKVYKSDADLYARKNLTLGKSPDVADPATQDLEQLQREKLQGEVARLKQQIDKMSFEMERDQGKYMLRSDLYREMASRWLVMDQALTHFFRSSAPDLVAIVNGQQDLIPDFLETVLAKLRQELNEFANTEKFHVVLLEAEPADA
ncbi:MAG: hypothetical protein M0P69_12015 [Bacteroidales bacterium]|nr:hypothetical protein [Bacteroidales bacterium]